MKTKANEELIEHLLFKQVDKPKNMCYLKIINLFDDKFRVNLYTATEEEGLTKKKIEKSYFVRVCEKAKTLEILSKHKSTDYETKMKV